MKLVRTLTLIVFIIASGNLNAQDSKANQSVENLNLSVTKLIIKGHDITDSLKTVSITNGMWIEYNRKDQEIGRASIIKNLNNEIKVKWISATNGAKKDAITIYKVKNEGNTYTFEIFYDDKKQGHFIAEAN